MPPLRGWRGPSGHLADQHQQVQREARSSAQPLERLVAERCESLVGRRVHETQITMAALDAGGKAVERNAGVLQRLRHLDAPHIAPCQPVGAIRRENAQLDQTVDVSQIDPGSVGRLRARVLTHEARLRPANSGFVRQDNRGRAGQSGRSIGRGIGVFDELVGRWQSVHRRYGQRRCSSDHQAELLGRIVRVHL